MEKYGRLKVPESLTTAELNKDNPRYKEFCDFEKRLKEPDSVLVPHGVKIEFKLPRPEYNDENPLITLRMVELAYGGIGLYTIETGNAFFTGEGLEKFTHKIESSNAIKTIRTIKEWIKGPGNMGTSDCDIFLRIGWRGSFFEAQIYGNSYVAGSLNYLFVRPKSSE